MTASDIFPLRLHADRQPKPPPRPQTPTLVQGGGCPPSTGGCCWRSTHGCYPHGCCRWWGTIQQAEGTYEDVEAVPVEVAVAAQAVPPAVTPCPGEEAEQQQVPEHSPHGGTGSSYGAGERKPVKPGRHRHCRAQHLHRNVPVLSPSSLLPTLPQTHMFPVSLPKLSFRKRSAAASSCPKQIRRVPA